MIYGPIFKQAPVDIRSEIMFYGTKDASPLNFYFFPTMYLTITSPNEILSTVIP